MKSSYITIDNSLFISGSLKNLASFLKYNENIEKIDSQDVYSKAVTVIIPTDIAEEFEYFKNKQDKLEYLESRKFTGNITSFAYFLYDSRKCIVEIHKIYGQVTTEAIDMLSQSFLTVIDNRCSVYLYFEQYLVMNVTNTLDIKDIPKNVIKCIAKNGFSEIYISKKSILGVELEKDSIFIVKENRYRPNMKKRNVSIISNKLDYALQFRDISNCYFYFYIAGKSLKYLKNLTKESGVTLNSGKLSQKEISGGFYIRDSIKKDGNIVFKFAVDESLLSFNKEEEADITKSRYNFHTHPFQAYIRHKVDIAWPSSSDYSAFLASYQAYNTIFHLLSSVEGVYIISFTKEWAERLPNIEIDNNLYNFISRVYDIPYINKSPKDYCKMLLSEKFNHDGYPVFNVQFNSWKDIKVFKIHFPKLYGNCFIE